MTITERFSRAFVKSMFRAGYILVIGLVWQVNSSPLMGQFGSSVQNFAQVVLNAGSTTSFTIHNPSPTEATEFTVRVKDMAGQEPVPEKTLTLNPRQSEAAFLDEDLLFGAGLTDFEGVVEISVNSPPVAVLSLIQ